LGIYAAVGVLYENTVFMGAVWHHWCNSIEPIFYGGTAFYNSYVTKTIMLSKKHNLLLIKRVLRSNTT